MQRRNQAGIEYGRGEINANPNDLREEGDRSEIDVVAAVALDQVIDREPEPMTGNQGRDEKADGIENRARPVEGSANSRKKRWEKFIVAT